MFIVYAILFSYNKLELAIIVRCFVTSEIRNQMQTRMDAEIVVLIGTVGSQSGVQSTKSWGVLYYLSIN